MAQKGLYNQSFCCKWPISRQIRVTFRCFQIVPEAFCDSKTRQQQGSTLRLSGPNYCPTFSTLLRRMYREPGFETKRGLWYIVCSCKLCTTEGACIKHQRGLSGRTPVLYKQFISTAASLRFGFGHRQQRRVWFGRVQSHRADPFKGLA